MIPDPQPDASAWIQFFHTGYRGKRSVHWPRQFSGLNLLEKPFSPKKSPWFAVGPDTQMKAPPGFLPAGLHGPAVSVGITAVGYSAYGKFKTNTSPR